ncbi:MULTISPECIES: ParA family protein [Hymenobacter]|uniref:Cellulose biosynthesis protein BcsQ n=1 Tax=Hymenobacter mucosus TaxID=1411120 RepID=A0A239AWK3_9BACT|nr:MULTISPECIES: ParA family protein [Hymenobacter]MDF7815510.1 ParA family protein [Hymenobacter sp. YC55]SNR99987.1 Cellulose biosynthesis protein BcsQ [Hymenobacter mucosus]
MSEPKVIAFATQKGGAGKSTISVHVASALAYVYGYKVAILDCDYPQNTIQVYRNQELQKVKTDEAFKDRLLNQGITPYPVSISSVEKSVDSIEALEKQGYDFILVDTPGTINVTGLPDLLRMVQYIFLPMEADQGTIASTVGYMQILGGFLKSTQPDPDESNLLGFYAFWNRFVKSEKKSTYDKIEAFFEEKGLPLLQSRVELLIGYKERRSTMFSLPERELDKLGMGKLIMEILSIVLGPGQVTPSGKTIEMPSATVTTSSAATTSDDSL